MTYLKLAERQLNNSKYIQRALNIEPSDLVSENPFFQKKTSRQSGCQIDYMIQTRYHCLYVCEIKCSKNQLGVSVIHEVEEKIKRLKIPKGFSCRPVLIHAQGVSEEVINTRYFAKIIDFTDILA